MDDLIVERHNGVGTVTINRPERRNALRSQTYAELIEAFDTLRDDAETGVIVLRGAGEKAFSSGGDVGEQRGRTQASGRAHLQRLLHTNVAIRGCGKPVIAAVDGFCIGGGNELALWCDLTIATERSTFGQVGPTVGSVPVWGATQILPLVIGEKRARELVFRCKRYSAQEAYAMGLVNEVTADDKLDEVVAEWCADLLDRSPQALRIAKQSLNSWIDLMWPSLTGGIELLSQIAGNEEQREGQIAFQEKRAPQWSRFRGQEASA
jgi:dihydroxynaphthoic acid synthetase